MEIPPEVVEFMILFLKVRSLADDDPDCVVDLAEADAPFAKLCSELWGAARSLSPDTYPSPPRFTAPVDPKFIEAWRDYETRWEDAVCKGNFVDIFGGRLLPPKPGIVPPTKWELAWKQARSAGQEFRFGIDAVIAFASQEFEVLHPDFSDRYWSGTPEADDERLEEISSVAFGLSHWSRYRGLFDFSGIIRRLHLVPFVLIPKLVAKRHGEAQPLSLYTQLRQAQEAFVFGILFAALAMMRSLLELVLREHYHAKGQELDDLINSAMRGCRSYGGRHRGRIRHGNCGQAGSNWVLLRTRLYSDRTFSSWASELVEVFSHSAHDLSRLGLILENLAASASAAVLGKVRKATIVMRGDNLSPLMRGAWWETFDRRYSLGAGNVRE